MGSGPITKEIFYMLLLEVIVVIGLFFGMIVGYTSYILNQKIRGAEIIIIKCDDIYRNMKQGQL